MTFTVRHAITEQDARRCWPVFRELRENIPTEEEYLRRWKVQREEGFQVVFIEDGSEVVAVGGYRISHSMAWGRFLYLDDLAALPARRGEGLGAAILGFVQEEARRAGCEAVHLDTGYHRHQAHKSYLRNGFEMTCHHMEWKADQN
jgi:GNAT superfamily N-acetyltransferase